MADNFRLRAPPGDAGVWRDARSKVRLGEFPGFFLQGPERAQLRPLAQAIAVGGVKENVQHGLCLEEVASEGSLGPHLGLSGISGAVR